MGHGGRETASMAVAWLHTQRVCLDAFFIDDGHKFDATSFCVYNVDASKPYPSPILHASL
jgi:hypothetical protein